MCGIVGYIGTREAQDILLGGLRRLEYRGYDSAGIVTISESRQATLLRARGKVEKLGQLVSDSENNDHVGIGHTRWATHGEPSDINCHPHKAGDIYLVHNGIIENYKQLKSELTSHTFISETDTEVLAALINSFYDDKTPLQEAVRQALELVVGTYGVAVVSPREPDVLIVARSGSPLVIGLGEHETLIASDASALIGHTTQVIYLRDGEMAICKADDVELQGLNSQPVSAQVETIEDDMQAVQKQGYDHFLLKEINEQPETIRSTLRGRLVLEEERVQLGGLNMTVEQLQDVKHVTIIGCGTASYAGMLASYYLEQLVDDVTVSVAVASEFRYRSVYMPKDSVALVVSQSGETADTLACVHELKRRGVRVLGVINTVGSTIAREVDGGIYIHAGPEISVASTKAFTSQVVALLLFALQLAQAKGMNREKTARFVQELTLLPDEIESILGTHQKEMEDVANKYTSYNHALFLGRDTLFPVALEGALKLKETSYIQAEGCATGELKHGSIALLDDRVFEVMLLMEGWLFDKSMSGLSEVNARGGHVLVLTNSKKEIAAETVVRVDTKLDLLTPLVLNILQQLLAYHVSVLRGNDVDQPRNLAKSVTVE